MAVLAYNEILPKTIIMYEGQPFEVLSSHVFRKQQRKPVNQTKLRHLVSGKVTEVSFHQSETVEEADVSTKAITYLYENRGEYWFCDLGKPQTRFSLPAEMVAEKVRWLKKNGDAEAILVDDEVKSVRIPIKVELKVTEAAPAVKGNTAQGATKHVTLETGATVVVPLFINEGDILRINTDTGDYTERVDKA